MYMRLVNFKLRPGKFLEYRKFYRERILPEFQKMEGCLYACLSETGHHKDECVSLTIWDSLESVEAYRRGGKHEQFLRESAALLSNSTEWRVQLSEELVLKYEPVHEAPIVKSYTIHAATGDEILAQQESDLMYLRVLRIKLKPGRWEDFKKSYVEQVIPVLRSVEGCRYACLMENIEAQNQAVSVTVWNSKADVEQYERSGLFDELMGKLKHAFPEFCQWKMGLEKQSGVRAVTSEDWSIESYTMVAGKSFKSA